MWLNHNTHCEATDIIARFCTHLDQCDLPKWRELFTPTAIFECKDATYRGREAIAQLPVQLRERCNGKVRHLITSVIIEPGESWRELSVQANGPVLDFGESCNVVGFHDYRLRLRKTAGWKIDRVAVTPVQDRPSAIEGLLVPAQHAASVSAFCA